MAETSAAAKTPHGGKWESTGAIMLREK